MQYWLAGILVILLALAFDRWPGDPSNRFHPLRWMGNILDAIDRRIKNRTQIRTGILGFLSYMAVLLLFGIIGLLITGALRLGLKDYLQFSFLGIDSNLGEVLWLIQTAYLIKICFSLFLFRKFCNPIIDDLKNGDTEAAAAKTQMMVNRKMAGMDEAHINSSCCETISENLVDSVVSPLLYGGMFGLFGAVMFRCANLMDAMWGRRTEKYNMIGHFPARWDDVLGYVPSRISPLFVGFAAWLMRIKNRRPALRAAMKEHKKTPSPNSGWPMTATSAAMGLSFEKEGVYVMGEGPLPSIDDIQRCYRLIEVASIAFALIVAVPLSVFLGTHIQIIMEDFIYGAIGVFA